MSSLEALAASLAITHEPVLSEVSRRDIARRRLRLMKKKELSHRISFLDHLKADLEVLISVQIAICYYADNSAIALILRLYGQQTFNFQQTDSREPTVHAYFARLIGLNVLIAGLHLYFQTLHPGEATRGYAHGGLILDFIGQKGPSSKMQLVLYDFVILVLQLIYLDVFRARRTLAQKQSTIVRSNGRREATQPTDRAPTIQELDAEERGAIQQEDESEILHDSGLTFDASDMLYSGQADLGTFYLFKVMKEKLQMTGTPGFRDGPSVLSNIVRDDIRRRRYTFDIPFRN